MVYSLHQKEAHMKKSMYSLMLADEVVKAVDAMAAEQGTNRSNMINQILAEHLSLTTPEKHVGQIFDVIGNLMGGRGDYRMYSEPNNLTMSIKSVLRYHYRPTIRYEVEMQRSFTTTMGQLKILFRTTSSELLLELTRFYKLWIQLEGIYLHGYFGDNPPRYGMEPGRFTRTFAIYGEGAYSDDEIGDAIGNYVATFDEILKGYLSGEYKTTSDMESRYLSYLNSGVRLI